MTFYAGQILTADELNAAFGNTGGAVPLAGGTMTGELIINNPSGTSLDARHDILVGGTLGVSGAGAVGGSLKVGGGVAAPTSGISAKAVTINPFGFPISAGAPQDVLLIASSLTGTITANNIMQWNEISVPSDTVTMSGTAPVLADLAINHNFGGTGFSGGRLGLLVNMVQTGAVSGTPGVFSNVPGGIQSSMTLTNTFGGSGTTPSTGAGFASSGNFFTRFTSGFKNGGGGGGIEIDMLAEAGSSYVDRFGLLVVSYPNDAVNGTRDDAAIALNGNSVSFGFKTGLLFGTQGAHSPVGPTGTLIAAKNANNTGTYTVDQIMDFSQVTATTALLSATGITISGTGATTITASGTGLNVSHNATVSGTLTIGAGISLGSVVGTGSNVDVVTPNGSNIRLIPQGNANVVAFPTGTGQFQAVTSAMFGGGTGTLATGEVGMTKISASGTAPGAGVAKLAVVAGTNAGTAKLIMYAGTSTTPVTIIDNVGGGF